MLAGGQHQRASGSGVGSKHRGLKGVSRVRKPGSPHGNLEIVKMPGTGHGPFRLPGLYQMMATVSHLTTEQWYAGPLLPCLLQKRKKKKHLCQKDN